MSRSEIITLYAVSVALTALGYYVDTDPPYENKFHTGMEFAIMSIIIFGILVGLYQLYLGIGQLLRKLFRK